MLSWRRWTLILRPSHECILLIQLIVNWFQKYFFIWHVFWTVNHILSASYSPHQGEWAWCLWCGDRKFHFMLLLSFVWWGCLSSFISIEKWSTLSIKSDYSALILVELSQQHDVALCIVLVLACWHRGAVAPTSAPWNCIAFEWSGKKDYVEDTPVTVSYTHLTLPTIA